MPSVAGVAVCHEISEPAGLFEAVILVKSAVGEAQTLLKDVLLKVGDAVPAVQDKVGIQVFEQATLTSANVTRSALG